jgi:hypothetical protein
MAVSDDRPPGIGHNSPPAPAAVELRSTRGISCDWTHPKSGGVGRPRRFVKYWRLYRDGKMIDSFLSKARAVQAMRRLLREDGDG